MADISEIILPNNVVYNIKDAYTRLQFSSNGNANRANSILYGKVDSTSTATAYTATIEGLDELVDGTTIMLHNGVVTSASGFTVNINNLGAKPCYNNMTNATRDTTIFNISYTMLFVYSTDLDDGNGGWWIYRGYDANSNTIGYQVRTNSGNKVASDTGYRYRLWLTNADGSKWVPINTSTSTNATTARTLNTRPIDPFGPIVYRPANSTCGAGDDLGATGIWQQYTLTIGYSYMASGFSLSFPDSVYLRCTPQADGSAIMQDIVQALPTTKDGKIYIHLGTAYSATNMELQIEHPVYWYDGTGIRLWTGVAIPTKTSDLTNDSGFITSSDIPEGSAASTTTPKMDGTAATGTEMAFARGDHVHPTDTSRQATLVSGTNIKTVMGESVLGSGNIALPTASTNTLGGVKIDGTSITINNGIISSSYTETDPTVPAWAKASTKPTYTAAEVGALPATTVIPIKVSDLTNDSGFISSYTETDPTVPSWAKAANKPTYTYSEVGAAAASHEHSAVDITSGILSISHGGTGESTATEAWTALGGGDIGKKNTLSASDIPSLDYLPLSGGTLTGDLKAPKIRSGNIVYGVSKYVYGGTAKETIVYTGIKYVSNHHMPIVHMSGYAYGAGKTTELHIAMYIYNGEFYSSSTVTNLGAWAPDVYLFTYTQNSIEYVAIGLSGEIYYNMMNIDVQDEKTNFSDIDLDNWNISGYTTTGNIPEIGTNHCKKLKYGIDILDRLPLTGGTLTGKLISKDSTLDATDTPSSNIYSGAIDFVDTNEKQFGNITRIHQSNGYYGIGIGVYDSDSNISNSLQLLLNSEGNRKIAVDNASIWRTALGVGAIGLKDTLTASDIPNLDASKLTTGTLDVARGGTGITAAPSVLTNLGSTAAASIFTASPRPGVTGTLSIAHGGTGKTTATEAWTALGGGDIGKLDSLSAANIPNLAASKITSGTLSVARGGTGKTSHTLNSVLIGSSTATTSPVQNVATKSGAFYATAANGKPAFGTLPIAQGGTGTTSHHTTITSGSNVYVYAWGPVITVECSGLVKAPGHTGNILTIPALDGQATRPAHNVSAFVATADASDTKARLYVDTDGNIKLASLGTTTSKTWYGTLTYIASS